MAAAVWCRLKWHKPWRARNAVGPRTSTAACAHAPHCSPKSAARFTHHRQEESTGALSPATPRVRLNFPASSRVCICTGSSRSLNRRTQRLSHRTHTLRPMYSGGAS